MSPVLYFACTLVFAQAPSGPATEDVPATAVENRLFLQDLLFGQSTDAESAPAFKIKGWTEASFTGSSARSNQLPMGFNYLPNEFLMQQNWLQIERPVDTKSSEATFGFHLDLDFYGSDYRFSVIRGLWDGQLTADNGSPNLYGIDPVQFFSEAYFPNFGNGLDVKIGRFYSPWGLESLDATLTPLASRSYTFIYDPFTHTGLLTTYALSDSVTIQNGIVLGSDVFIDPAASPTYVGDIKWAPPGGSDTLLLFAILGSGRYNQSQNFNNQQVLNLVWTHKFNDQWNYSLDALYGFQNNIPNHGFADWFGIVNYLTRIWTPKLSTIVRWESFYDAEGTRTGYEGLYTAITGGINAKPINNLTLRPEIRYDHNSETQPFNGKANLCTATIDVIVHW